MRRTACALSAARAREDRTSHSASRDLEKALDAIAAQRGAKDQALGCRCGEMGVMGQWKALARSLVQNRGPGHTRSIFQEFCDA